MPTPQSCGTASSMRAPLSPEAGVPDTLARKIREVLDRGGSKQ
jgi:hypothetical protein